MSRLFQYQQGLAFFVQWRSLIRKNLFYREVLFSWVILRLWSHIHLKALSIFLLISIAFNSVWLFIYSSICVKLAVFEENSKSFLELPPKEFCKANQELLLIINSVIICCVGLFDFFVTLSLSFSQESRAAAGPEFLVQQWRYHPHIFMRKNRLYILYRELPLKISHVIVIVSLEPHTLRAFLLS